MSTIRICIFASGSGTNAEKIIQHFQQKETASVVLVSSNKADAKVLERASRFKVPTHVFNREDFYESNAIIDVLHQYRVTHVVLAGFLLQVPSSLLKAFPNRVLNIHPSLLPKFGGKGMYGMKVHEAVKAASERETGITIHEVNEEYDKGKIIFQATCAIDLSDTPIQIAQKVQALEYNYYPVVIEKWTNSKGVDESSPTIADLKFLQVQPDNHNTIQLIADWYFSEWKIPVDKTIQRLKTITRDDSQLQVVMTLDGIPISTGGLYHQVGLTDKQPRFAIYKNWLAQVYTTPGSRHQGFGALICNYIQDYSKKIGVKEMYLFTDTAETLYKRLGWYSLERVSLGERNVIVMKKEL
jgi:phosphoribosylglycinamide formyltransferase 1